MIPSKDLTDVYDPSMFPDELEQVNPINELQLKRWLRRLKKLMCHSLRHHNYYF
ncbi:hypothetical protein HW555_008731 [Spodoptera exigua]|uniref:Uncharacterized protein n=1 Tax=Spodoptera exigua TaxID=7107 RepID=A0A835GDT2_SPOEX|nr:hypothetical protein HW555_008731 [Spodoptera exigua]